MRRSALFADRLGLSARAVYLIFGAWGGFAWAFINAAYALYYITVAHLDPFQLVLVGTALEASYFVWEIPTGVLADTFSRRLSIILGTALGGIAWMGTGFVPVFIFMVGFEILRGLAEAFTHGAVEAWVAGECGEDGLEALFLRETQLTQIAGFVGLPIGVLLATLDLRIPIVLGGALGVALAVFLVLAMPERHHPRRDAARTWRATVGTAQRGLMAVRTSALLVALLGAQFFWGAASEGWDRLGEAHLLLDLQFPPNGLSAVVAFGALSLLFSVLVIVTAQLMRRIVRDMEQHVVSRLLLAVQLVLVACQTLFALAPSWGFALVPYALNAMLRASFYPLFNAWLIRKTDEDVRATVLSTTSVSSALGQVGGGPLSGAIGGSFGIPLGLLSSALMLLPGTLFFARAIGLRAATGYRGRPGPVAPSPSP
ncbi:MAG TPA: MFS transporter [Verrucomicrobiae bacterium]|nr:MFS transporter [Verrucomicrobiae bacterium]